MGDLSLGKIIIIIIIIISFEHVEGAHKQPNGDAIEESGYTGL